MRRGRPSLVVFSSLFPSPAQPLAGIFVRERMYRVGLLLPVVVVAPRPWFPGQRILRIWRPQFRPDAPAHEMQDGVEVFRPRFLSVPGLLKRWDGVLMAFGAWPTMRRLRRESRCDVIDAHFGYPDGYAATLLGRWLARPVTITLRGTEARHARDPVLAARLYKALARATRIFAVAEALKSVAVALGIDPSRVRVVGNGVDSEKFSAMDKAAARAALDIAPQATVLITVGGLCERKGFHRVIECLPALLRTNPDIVYLVVGGASPEGDWSDRLATMVRNLGLAGHVRFLGALPSDNLRVPLSAADVFVLPTRNEGWANVLLEAMACGLPVVTTDVGGNREVVRESWLGTIVAFGDQGALTAAVGDAIGRTWDRGRIIDYARRNSWDSRVATLAEEFKAIDAEAFGMPHAADRIADRRAP